MLDVGYRAVGHSHYEQQPKMGWAEHAREIWQRMYDAAPEAPLPGQSAREAQFEKALNIIAGYPIKDPENDDARHVAILASAWLNHKGPLSALTTPSPAGQQGEAQLVKQIADEICRKNTGNTCLELCNIGPCACAEEFAKTALAALRASAQPTPPMEGREEIVRALTHAIQGWGKGRTSARSLADICIQIFEEHRAAPAPAAMAEALPWLTRSDDNPLPYTPAEKRVVDYILEHSDAGGGNDPIGFILASYAYKTSPRVAEWATELLRLYDLRFQLAKREKAGEDVRAELRTYGEQKKRGWTELRAALSHPSAMAEAKGEVTVEKRGNGYVVVDHGQNEFVAIIDKALLGNWPLAEVVAESLLARFHITRRASGAQGEG